MLLKVIASVVAVLCPDAIPTLARDSATTRALFETLRQNELQSSTAVW